MDDTNRQNTESSGDAATDSRSMPSPPRPPSYPSPGAASPSQPARQGSSGSYLPPPPPPPKPKPYSPPPQAGPDAPAAHPGGPYPQPASQPQQPGSVSYGGSGDPGYGSHNQPTQAYPQYGQIAPSTPTRYEQPTEVYLQGVYGTPPGVGPSQGYPPQGGYSPQGAYPPQYPVQPPFAVAATAATSKQGVPLWAWLVPLLLALAVGGALIAWSVIQSQENERKEQAAATATAQAQATATAAQAEINRKATAASQKTAAAATEAANKRATSTAQARATSTARAEATSSAVAAIAARTATAIAQADLSRSQTATAFALIPVGVTPTIGGTGEVGGQVQDVTVDYDVTEQGLKGMRIHVKFTVDNVKGKRCQATAYFYYSDGQPVKDLDSKYNTVDGQVAASEPFTPGFDSTVYDDFTIFLPYDELHLGPGKYTLRFQVQAYILSPYTLITASDYVDFNFTK